LQDVIDVDIRVCCIFRFYEKCGHGFIGMVSNMSGSAINRKGYFLFLSVPICLQILCIIYHLDSFVWYRLVWWLF